MKKDDLINRVGDYSNILTVQDIGGTSCKNFARLNDNSLTFEKSLKKGKEQSDKKIKDSKYFSGLFTALGDKNCHYVTYINELIVGKNKEDTYLPQYISCLMKENREGWCFGEVVGSRLANALEIDTVYNYANEVYGKFDDPKVDFPEFDYILSVDFVQTGQTIENMENLGLCFMEEDNLDYIMKKIDRKIPLLAVKQRWNMTADNLHKFKEDFARLYLFRNLLCEDYDFEAKNIVIVRDENGDFRIGPCMDMELFFSASRSKKYSEEFARKNINICAKMFPNMTKDFIQKITRLKNSGMLKNIMEKSIKVRHEYINDKYETLCRNINTMASVYNEVVLNNSMEI